MGAELKAGLQSKDPLERSQACRDLATRKRISKDSVQVLRALSGDSDPLVAAAAAETLKHFNLPLRTCRHPETMRAAGIPAAGTVLQTANFHTRVLLSDFPAIMSSKTEAKWSGPLEIIGRAGDIVAMFYDPWIVDKPPKTPKSFARVHDSALAYWHPDSDILNEQSPEREEIDPEMDDTAWETWQIEFQAKRLGPRAPKLNMYRVVEMLWKDWSMFVLCREAYPYAWTVGLWDWQWATELGQWEDNPLAMVCEGLADLGDEQVAHSLFEISGRTESMHYLMRLLAGDKTDNPWNEALPLFVRGVSPRRLLEAATLHQHPELVERITTLLYSAPETYLIPGDYQELLEWEGSQTMPELRAFLLEQQRKTSAQRKF